MRGHPWQAIVDTLSLVAGFGRSRPIIPSTTFPAVVTRPSILRHRTRPVSMTAERSVDDWSLLNNTPATSDACRFSNPSPQPPRRLLRTKRGELHRDS
jgi:hypothetical protein